jgi:hypothetical protein
MNTVTPVEIRSLLDSGVDEDEIIRSLVATGNWSEPGAKDIVSSLPNGGDLVGARVRTAPEPDCPGPIDDVGPLFAP